MITPKTESLTFTSRASNVSVQHDITHSSLATYKQGENASKKYRTFLDGDPSETVGLYSPPQAPPIAAGHWPPRETKAMPIFKENVAA